MAIWISAGVKVCSTQDPFWLALPCPAYFYMKSVWSRWAVWDINKLRYLIGFLSTGFSFSWNICFFYHVSLLQNWVQQRDLGYLQCFRGEVRLCVMRNTSQEINTTPTWGKWTLYTMYSYNGHCSQCTQYLFWSPPSNTMKKISL